MSLKNRYFGKFIHLVVCLTTGPKPIPKPALHIVRSRASSFKWEYPLLSLRSSNSFLRLLHRLHVTSIPPFIFPSISCCRRLFLRKMWPIQLAFRLLISCRVFLCSVTLSYRNLKKKIGNSPQVKLGKIFTKNRCRIINKHESSTVSAIRDMLKNQVEVTRA